MIKYVILKVIPHETFSSHTAFLTGYNLPYNSGSFLNNWPMSNSADNIIYWPILIVGLHP